MATTALKQGYIVDGKIFDTAAEARDYQRLPQVKAAISDAKWQEFEGENKLKLTWTILDGEFKNRKVFQNIKRVFTELHLESLQSSSNGIIRR